MKNGQRVLMVIKKSSCVYDASVIEVIQSTFAFTQNDNTKTPLLCFFFVIVHNQIAVE